nr:MAG: hypothetical protein [Wufeng shrew polycipivirus 2]
MTEQQMSYNPPRLVNVPPQPLPQTVCATLEHSGIPTSQEQQITDIPPLFDWMSQYQLYKGSFRFETTDTPKQILYTTQIGAHIMDSSDGVIDNKYLIPWNYIPFLASKWWTGEVSYKFIAIKPKAVVGKLLIRYAFDEGYDFTTDAQRRAVAVEWDLGLSSEISFDVNGLFPAQQRPTWIPRVLFQQASAGVLWAPQRLPYPEWYMGDIQVEVAQKLVPGSLFPDSIRILVFMVYKNTEFFLQTDLRGKSSHILALPTDAISWNVLPVG